MIKLAIWLAGGRLLFPKRPFRPAFPNSPHKHLFRREFGCSSFPDHSWLRVLGAGLANKEKRTGWFPGVLQNHPNTLKLLIEWVWRDGVSCDCWEWGRQWETVCMLEKSIMSGTFNRVNYDDGIVDAHPLPFKLARINEHSIRHITRSMAESFDVWFILVVDVHMECALHWTHQTISTNSTHSLFWSPSILIDSFPYSLSYW